MFRCLVCPENCECDQHDDGLSILGGVEAPLMKLPYVLPIDVVALRISREQHKHDHNGFPQQLCQLDLFRYVVQRDKPN